MGIFDWFKDEPNGPGKIYYENGKLKSEGYYNNGVPCGLWKMYDDEGQFIGEKTLNEN